MFYTKTCTLLFSSGHEQTIRKTVACRADKKRLNTRSRLKNDILKTFRLVNSPKATLHSTTNIFVNRVKCEPHSGTANAIAGDKRKMVCFMFHFKRSARFTRHGLSTDARYKAIFSCLRFTNALLFSAPLT